MRLTQRKPRSSSQKSCDTRGSNTRLYLATYTAARDDQRKARNHRRLNGTLMEYSPTIKRKGKFVVATNELDRAALSDEQFLEAYKDRECRMSEAFAS